MREFRTLGSVRGAARKGGPYRNRTLLQVHVVSDSPTSQRLSGSLGHAEIQAIVPASEPGTAMAPSRRSEGTSPLRPLAAGTRAMRLDDGSRMSREVHVRFCESRGVRFPPATRLVVGFEHLGDAKQFLRDLRSRFAKFNLELHPEKTRLIQFGRFAAQNRAERGLGKPETFDFLGFTHFCGKTKDGRFWLRRITIAKRMRAKLRALKEELLRRRHLPIPVQGRWLASVVRGHLAYYAVPGNIDAVSAFRDEVRRLWREALRRRSQRSRLTWERMGRLSTRWLPPARIVHQHPVARFAART